MEKGIVVGYKVVWILASCLATEITFMLYSSETRLWKTEKARCVRRLSSTRPNYSVSLNGILHWLDSAGATFDAHFVVSYDCFSSTSGGGNGDGDDKRLSIRPFPGIKNYEHTTCFKRTITTSAGFLVYCNVFDKGRTIRVWRLVKYEVNGHKAWTVSWALDTKPLSLVRLLGADYFPVVMHPLNSNIIYLWSRKKNALVLLNLRTRRFSLHKEEDEESSEEKNKSSMDGCSITLSGCKEYMNSIFPEYINGLRCSRNLYFSQYVLPRWLNPLPHLSS